MQKNVQGKDSVLFEKRLIELSRKAYQREIITYTDFLNLNEQNILHRLPKDRLFCRFQSFGGYVSAERQMAAFIPDALYLRSETNTVRDEEISYPFSAVIIRPLNRKFCEELTHRDYLGAILNLGIERSKTGDIIPWETDMIVFVHRDMTDVVCSELTRIRHTSVKAEPFTLDGHDYKTKYEEIRSTVASVRLDSLLPVVFSSSRSKLSGLIENARVFVNGKLITSNGYQLSAGDIISVRGMGKFQYIGTDGHSRKNRICVVIHKYV